MYYCCTRLCMNVVHSPTLCCFQSMHNVGCITGLGTSSSPPVGLHAPVMFQVGGVPGVHRAVKGPCVPLTQIALQTPLTPVVPHAQIALARGAGWPEHVAASKGRQSNSMTLCGGFNMCPLGGSEMMMMGHLLCVRSWAIVVQPVDTRSCRTYAQVLAI